MKVKKAFIRYCTVLFVGCSVLFSCATNGPVVEYEIGDEDFDQVALAEEIEASEPEPVPEEPATKEKKKEKEKKNKAKKEPENEDETWVAAKKRNIDVTFGIIRIKVKPNYGLFNISVVNNADKTIPVLSTSNEYVSSSFYLKYGKKIYKLNENSSVKCSADVNYEEKIVKLIYEIPNVAVVNVQMKAIQSSPEGDYDMLRISSEVVNSSSKKADFAQKVVLDTVLGEVDRHHFYDNENIPVRNETGIRTPDGKKWFVSRNSNASMQILPFGYDTTAPALFALANLGTFENGTWEPDMISYRAFDTVLSYNNSAVCIIWPEKNILSTEKNTNVFYLAFAAGDSKPEGEFLVYAQEDKKSPSTPQAPAVTGIPSPVAERPPVVFNEPKKTEADSEKKTYDFSDEAQKGRETGLSDASSVSFQNKNAEDEFKAPSPDVEVVNPKVLPSYEQNIFNPRSDVQFDVASPSRYQLSDEYIQNLLNRIAALEESGEAVNRSELLQLNAELDAILEALRQ